MVVTGAASSYSRRPSLPSTMILAIPGLRLYRAPALPVHPAGVGLDPGAEFQLDGLAGPREGGHRGVPDLQGDLLLVAVHHQLQLLVLDPGLLQPFDQGPAEGDQLAPG